LDSTAGGVDLFVTSLFRETFTGFAEPESLVHPTRDQRHPYIAEGTGTSIFYEPRVLGTIWEHQARLSRTRAETAIDIMKKVTWQAFIYVFTFTERSHHTFWKFREPAIYEQLLNRHPLYRSHAPTASQITLYHDIIDKTYEQVDRYVGEMLALTGESTLIVIVSDHGHQGGHNPTRPTAGVHHEEGIYLVVGPHQLAAREATEQWGPTLRHIDILPMVLSHLGYPLARDLAGHVPRALTPVSTEGRILDRPDPIETYETGETGMRRLDVLTEELEDQLRSLGYIH
jgi:hypothetical protein